MTAAGPTTRATQFGPLVVEYDERVLAPRPWTLAQSTWAAELAAGAPPGPILELCAGAGHIGLAAAVLAGRDLVQVEADPVAVGFARANATRAGWADRVAVRCARLDDALRPDELFPLIVADPPYLRSADVGRWPEDPRPAIDGGPDGLAVVTECLALTAAHLAPSGRLLLQVAGRGQAEQVADLLRGRAWELCVAEVRLVDADRAVVLIE